MRGYLLFPCQLTEAPFLHGERRKKKAMGTRLLANKDHLSTKGQERISIPHSMNIAVDFAWMS